MPKPPRVAAFTLQPSFDRLRGAHMHEAATETGEPCVFIKPIKSRSSWAVLLQKLQSTTAEVSLRKDSRGQVLLLLTGHSATELSAIAANALNPVKSRSKPNHLFFADLGWLEAQSPNETASGQNAPLLATLKIARGNIARLKISRLKIARPVLMILTLICCLVLLAFAGLASGNLHFGQPSSRQAPVGRALGSSHADEITPRHQQQEALVESLIKGSVSRLSNEFEVDQLFDDLVASGADVNISSQVVVGGLAQLNFSTSIKKKPSLNFQARFEFVEGHWQLMWLHQTR